MAIIYYATGDKTDLKAVIQPLRYKNKLYLSHKPTELSYDTFQKFLLITDPDVPLERVDNYSYKLYMDETYFKVDHCERVYLGNKPYYYWAIVSKEGG